MAFKRVIAQSLLTAAALLAHDRAFADDAPVEKPAVDRPALPQPSPASPASPATPAKPATATHAAGPGETPHGSRQASSAHTAAATQAGGDNRQRSFVYFAGGPGVLSGLSGGQDFERTNAAFTGAVGVEIPLRPATGLGFELNGDLEFAGQGDRGTYTALLVRARLGQMLTPRNRLWGAVGLGGAGYESTSLAFGLAAGTSLMLMPKFGLDLSANLNLLSSASTNNGIQNPYPGGAVLVIALRALFELHR
jgi:hypothetical protein